MRKKFQTYDESPIPLTPEGLKRLERHLSRLKEALPHLIEETARTAAFGDRSDNAEYKFAKSAMRRTTAQIWNIEQQLKQVEVINSGKNTSGIVHLGSTVVLESTKGTKSEFQIVGPYETNPSKGRISHLSPLGAALMGRKKGDKVTVTTVRGAQEYCILEIR